MVEKYIEYLDNSVSLIRKADHMAYITYPLIKDKQLIFNALNGIYTSLLGVISAILQYEYFYKRISLSQDSRTNMQTFSDKCAFRYGITEQELNMVYEIFKMAENHKKSPFEFVKKDKIVIMTDNFHAETMTLEKIKNYILVGKSVLKKAEDRIRRKL